VNKRQRKKRLKNLLAKKIYEKLEGLTKSETLSDEFVGIACELVDECFIKVYGISYTNLMSISLHKNLTT